MKKILVLAIALFVIGGGSVSSQGRWEDEYENNPMCGICPMPDWVKRNMITRGCSLDYAVCIPINYGIWGCSHYILDCLGDKKEPSPYVIPIVAPLVSPLPIPFVSPLYIQELVEEELVEAGLVEQEDHCFAFGFPCTDYNPGAQEGCICFCSAEMWCPN